MTNKQKTAQKALEKKRKRILALIKQRYSMSEIGKMKELFDKPVSRQRVFNIVHRVQYPKGISTKV